MPCLRGAVALRRHTLSVPRRGALSGSPTSRPSVVAPITALSADGGRLNPPASPRSPNPPLTAAQSFARLLQQRDIQVLGEPHTGTSPPVTRWRRSNPPRWRIWSNTSHHLRQHRSRHPGSPGRPGGAGRSDLRRWCPRHPAGTGGARHRHQRHRAQRRQRAVAATGSAPSA